MSFYSDKKAEEEAAAISALEKNDYREAYIHVLKAAEHGYHLAEQSDGPIAQAYLKDADELSAQAERIKAKCSQLEGCDDTKTEDGQKSPWLMTEKPDIKLKDVAGLEDVKKVIYEDLIDANQYKDAYKRLKIAPGGGALMYGPPGNGKTFIAKAIAGELNAAFFSVSGADIKDKYVGETEKNMKRLFEEAAKYDQAIVFIDEIQSLLARRGSEKVSAVDQFLVMTDGIISRKNNLLLLGATNYPWMLDDAVFRRLQKLIYVGMPDAPARNKIFRLQFEGVPTDGELPYDEFEEESTQFSGADIARICGAAKKIAFQRVKTSSTEPKVSADDVFQAIQETRPSVNLQLIQKYKDWEKSFSGADSSFHDDE